MVGFKKKLPMSAAMRQGGEGVVNPQDVKKSDAFDLGSIKGSPSPFNPKGPTNIGKGVKTTKMPAAPKGLKPPKFK